MLTCSDTEQPTFQILGRTLRINHSHSTTEREDIDGSKRTEYQCYTAITDILADRNSLIEAIIASKYSLTAELAVINNSDIHPEEYIDYQNFRTFAKSLADEWLNK